MRVLFDLRTPAIIGAFKNARLVFITAAIDQCRRSLDDDDDPEPAIELARQSLHRTMWELMGFIRDEILVYRVDAAGTLCVEDAVIDHFKPAYDDFYTGVAETLRHLADEDVMDDIVEIMDEFFSTLYDITEQELTMVGNFLCEFT